MSRPLVAALLVSAVLCIALVAYSGIPSVAAAAGSARYQRRGRRPVTAVQLPPPRSERTLPPLPADEPVPLGPAAGVLVGEGTASPLASDAPLSGSDAPIPSFGGPRGGERSTNNRFVVVTGDPESYDVGSKDRAFAPWAAASALLYSAVHNDTDAFIVDLRQFPHAKGPGYRRIPALQSVLPRYEWAVWMDADTVIPDLRVELADIARDADADTALIIRSVALPAGASASGGVDHGVFMVRNNAVGRALLQAWTDVKAVKWGLEDLSDLITLLNFEQSLDRNHPAAPDGDRFWKRTLIQNRTGLLLQHLGGACPDKQAGERSFAVHYMGAPCTPPWETARDLVCAMMLNGATDGGGAASAPTARSNPRASFSVADRDAAATRLLGVCGPLPTADVANTSTSTAVASDSSPAPAGPADEAQPPPGGATSRFLLLASDPDGFRPRAVERTYATWAAASALAYSAVHADTDVLVADRFGSRKGGSAWRVEAMRELLPRYEWVLWLDAFTVIPDLSVELGEVVRSVDASTILIVGTDLSGATMIDPGVLMIRNSTDAMALLDAWAGIFNPRENPALALLTLLNANGTLNRSHPVAPDGDRFLNRTHIVSASAAAAAPSSPATPLPLRQLVSYGGRCMNASRIRAMSPPASNSSADTAAAAVATTGRALVEYFPAGGACLPPWGYARDVVCTAMYRSNVSIPAVARNTRASFSGARQSVVGQLLNFDGACELARPPKTEQPEPQAPLVASGGRAAVYRNRFLMLGGDPQGFRPNTKEQAFAPWAAASVLTYAALHNDTDPILADRRRYPHKKGEHFWRIPALKELLPHYDWALWVDADTVIPDFTIDLDELVRDVGADTILIVRVVRVTGASQDINNGIFMIRNHPEAFALLQAWSDMPFSRGEFHDQSDLITLLNFEKRLNQKHEAAPDGDRFWKRTKFQDREGLLLQHYGGRCTNDRRGGERSLVEHYPGGCTPPWEHARRAFCKSFDLSRIAIDDVKASLRRVMAASAAAVTKTRMDPGVVDRCMDVKEACKVARRSVPPKSRWSRREGK